MDSAQKPQTHLSCKANKATCDLLLFSCILVLTGLYHFLPVTFTYLGVKIRSRERGLMKDRSLWSHLELPPFAILFRSQYQPGNAPSLQRSQSKSQECVHPEYPDVSGNAWRVSQPGRYRPRSCLGGVPVQLMTFLPSGPVGDAGFNLPVGFCTKYQICQGLQECLLCQYRY